MRERWEAGGRRACGIHSQRPHRVATGAAWRSLTHRAAEWRPAPRASIGGDRRLTGRRAPAHNKYAHTRTLAADDGPQPRTLFMKLSKAAFMAAWKTRCLANTSSTRREKRVCSASSCCTNSVSPATAPAPDALSAPPLLGGASARARTISMPGGAPARSGGGVGCVRERWEERGGGASRPAR